jgi:substrate import-associated zinc metallohydrolase lipoprotein
LWLETYVECKDINFLRQYTPRVIHLIGSGAYNSTNTVTLGTAHSAMMITIYSVNNLSPNNPSVESLREYMRTIFHEFSHILHQKKGYSPDFWRITNNDYVMDDWANAANTLQMANQLGFVSRYARKEPNEDFVEIIARYVVYGPAEWEAVLRAAGTAGADKLSQKMDIVRDYLTVSWGIDLDELHRIFENRIGNIDKLDLTHL